MTVFSLWAGVKFLGVFDSKKMADLVYSEYEFAVGAEDCGEKVIFESELNDLYEGK